MKRLDSGHQGDALRLAPSEEFPNRAAIGAAGVGVADGVDEEFEEADARLRGSGFD